LLQIIIGKSYAIFELSFYVLGPGKVRHNLKALILRLNLKSSPQELKLMMQKSYLSIRYYRRSLDINKDLFGRETVLRFTIDHEMKTVDFLGSPVALMSVNKQYGHLGTLQVFYVY
jgi:hypothetical protein